MDLGLKGKKAIITGGSKGIGLASAHALADEGVDVAICSRNIDDVNSALDALKGIMMTHKAIGHMPKGLIDTRMGIFDDLMKQSKKKYRNH